MSATFDSRSLQTLSSGLYIISSKDKDRINGQLVNTVIQVTSDPARLAVIINRKNLTHEFISASKVFTAMVIAETAPMTFFGPFGFRTGRDFDKFANAKYKKGITGCPVLLENILSYLEVEVSEHLDVETHTIFVGKIVACEVLAEGTPLTYHYYHKVLKGKSSKNAPTYVPS
ncbi:MAG: flavin reductase family protein [Spirochaetota bacterium]